MDCLFCKIIKGEIPSYTLYENEYVKCFLDINPLSTCHTLIVTKEHFLDNEDISDKALCEIHKASLKIISLIENNYNVLGYRLVQNNRNMQEVKHYHIHIIFDIKNNNESVEDVYNKLKNNFKI